MEGRFQTLQNTFHVFLSKKCDEIFGNTDCPQNNTRYFNFIHIQLSYAIVFICIYLIHLSKRRTNVFLNSELQIYYVHVHTKNKTRDQFLVFKQIQRNIKT